MSAKRLKPRFDRYLYHSSAVNKRFILKKIEPGACAGKNRKFRAFCGIWLKGNAVPGMARVDDPAIGRAITGRDIAEPRDFCFNHSERQLGK
jgi:hypothetical protein